MYSEDTHWGLSTLFGEPTGTTTQQSKPTYSMSNPPPPPPPQPRTTQQTDTLFDMSVEDISGIATAVIGATPKEGAFTNEAARSAWNRMFMAYNITSAETQRGVMVRVLWYACLNSTSTQQGFQGRVTIDGAAHPMFDVLSKLGVLAAEWRRFVRADINLQLLDKMMAVDAFAKELKERAQLEGIDPECYRAMLDVQLPHLTKKEKAAAAMVSQKRLREDQTVAAVQHGQQVALAANQGHASTSAPPPPTGPGGSW